MAKITIFLALLLVVAVSATPLDFNQLHSITPQQLEAFKEELEEETSENKITCENYKDICALGGERSQDPNSVCQITLRSYLCDGLQDLKGVAEILERVKQAHPDAINPAAGREFELEPDVEPEEEEAQLDDADDEYEDSKEPIEIEYD